MASPAETPGAALVVLRRRTTSTDVMLVGAPGTCAALPWRAVSGGGSQAALAEDLLRESGVGDASRLYASPISLFGNAGPLGVFVAFLEEERGHGPAPRGARWMDLREACRELEPIWSGALADVRRHFVARSPDEALRIR